MLTWHGQEGRGFYQLMKELAQERLVQAIRAIASSVCSFANGMAPVMAVEVARRSLTSDIKPSAEGLEEMLKNIGKK